MLENRGDMSQSTFNSIGIQQVRNNFNKFKPFLPDFAGNSQLGLSSIGQHNNSLQLGQLSNQSPAQKSRYPIEIRP